MQSPVLSPGPHEKRLLFKLHIRRNGPESMQQAKAEGDLECDRSQSSADTCGRATAGAPKARHILKPRPISNAEIQRLQQLVSEKQRQVDVLWARRQSLRGRTLAVDICVHQCFALCRLGKLLQPYGGTAAQAGHHAWPTASTPAHDWNAQREQMRQQLEHLAAPQGATPSLGHYKLGWSPDAAAAMAPTADVSTRGLRRALRQFNEACGLHYL